ncbi:hypothetical protein EI427_11460 [Flammeovirga pectinis]|uniref:Uncharacterized protein n=1 Tax=Flammeovirga pectinis TaxID=2494373 RepID=A0A3S9P3X7_9BACT|nr:hypothetical protein [Flammeovirga pectinis]AZQ62828.1 hypothetical protein EI427_11460 [Flammeovirga pectinis]
MKNREVNPNHRFSKEDNLSEWRAYINEEKQLQELLLSMPLREARKLMSQPFFKRQMEIRMAEFEQDRKEQR